MLTIKELRENRGLSQTEFAKKMAVSLRTVQNWEANQDKIPMDKLVKIYKELESDLPKIESIIHKSKTEFKPEITGYYYPNVAAAAGMDKEMQNDELKRIPINLPNWEKGIDFINVYGDSMYPKFCSGEIIGIKEVELQYLNYGFAYVVILKDGQVLLKFIKKGSDKDHIILESENKFYESKEYHLDQVKKVFIIKGVITKTTM
ncbi:S24 family peptidase [Flavobacterium sp.]|uniref:S24 family peptidase n=1 Tax=Flavobacterium sp. TaxID=239 RepID=UPI003751D6CA